MENLSLLLAKIEGKRRRGQQRMRWLDSITDSKDMNEQSLGDNEGQVCCNPPQQGKGRGSSFHGWLGPTEQTQVADCHPSDLGQVLRRALFGATAVLR